MAHPRLMRAHHHLLLVAALLLTAGLGSGCVFDNQLDEQRCLNDSACTTRFGADFRCVDEVCQKLGPATCDLEENPDQACQSRDGFFCNGLEVCNPDSPDADAFGCVAGPVPGLDDGVACTADYCDEDLPANQRIIHDPSGCECQGDAICRALNSSPCVTSSCHPTNFNCVTTPVEAGSSCDDGIACTVGTVCDESGACVAGADTLDDGVCDDDVFCNGEERCAPEEASADPASGCVAGTPPTADDGIECTIAVCNEADDRIEQDPRACECTSVAECEARAADCHAYRCNAATAFTCERTGETLQSGTFCDDGASCTAQDTCRDGGVCAGTPVHQICAFSATCETGTPFCTPDPDPEVNAQTEGCVCQE